MTRHLPRLATLALVVTVSSLNSGCGLLLGAALAGARQSCTEAVDVCEDFVVTFCDRAEACGLLDFEECSESLIEGDFPCERAVRADDIDGCIDDFEDISCEDLAAKRSPRSCDDLQLEFSDDVCR